MKQYTWKDVTVFQWQQLMNLYREEGNSALDLIVRAGSIVTGKTEHEIDGMTMAEINELGKVLSFIHQDVPANAARHIDVNGRRYRCIYDVRRMPAARYIEAKHFSQDLHNNLHRLAASMIWPQRRLFRFGPWVDDRYDAALHAQYAEDMLAAPITAVFGSVVFFCEVYIKSIMNLRGFMVDAILRGTPNLTREQATTEWENLCVGLDGTIRQAWSRNMNGFDSARPTN